MEHPFYGSWGYQTTGYFAPTARYGSPTDLMAMVDRLHQRGVGVILDWVPSHFPMDAHGLARFDGTHLYEHADPRQGFHPDWTSAIFNYGRRRGALVPHLERAVAGSSATTSTGCGSTPWRRCSTSTTRASRASGSPTASAAARTSRRSTSSASSTTAVGEEYPDTATFAEESTAWPMVTGAVADGGLGFTYKWDMGWMHDTLQYVRRDPVHRRFHHDEITFRCVYAFSERYVLPLSHDEVVYGKGSLLGKMPGDEWQRFANLRLLFGMMWAQPGKKLLFMGGELATPSEWAHERTLDWALHDAPNHAGVRRWSPTSTALYRAERGAGARRRRPRRVPLWWSATTTTHSVFAWLRRDPVGVPRLGARRWSTPRRPSTTATGSACPTPAAGPRSSTPTPPTTAAAASATSAASPPTASVGTASTNRCR